MLCNFAGFCSRVSQNMLWRANKIFKFLQLVQRIFQIAVLRSKLLHEVIQPNLVKLIDPRSDSLFLCAF